MIPFQTQKYKLSLSKLSIHTCTLLKLNNNNNINWAKKTTNLVLSNLFTDFLQVTISEDQPNIPLLHKFQQQTKSNSPQNQKIKTLYPNENKLFKRREMKPEEEEGDWGKLDCQFYQHESSQISSSLCSSPSKQLNHLVNLFECSEAEWIQHCQLQRQESEGTHSKADKASNRKRSSSLLLLLSLPLLLKNAKLRLKKLNLG